MENQMQLIANYHTITTPRRYRGELHEKLGMKHRYAKWFGRMCEYGLKKENLTLH